MEYGKKEGNMTDISNNIALWISEICEKVRREVEEMWGKIKKNEIETLYGSYR